MPSICDVINREDIRTKMSRLIDETERINKEHYFKFCSNGNVNPSDSCIGGKTSVTGIKKCSVSCPEGTIQNGSFHTHPTDSGKLKENVLGRQSSADIFASIHESLETACIGYKDGALKSVRCWESPFGVPRERVYKYEEALSEYRFNRKKYVGNDDKYKPDVTDYQKKELKDARRHYEDVKHKLEYYVKRLAEYMQPSKCFSTKID